MVLHEIDEVRVYCGPAALMAVTGLRLPRVRSVINKAREKQPNQGVCGLSNSHLEQAMQLLGIVYTKHVPAVKTKLKNMVFEKDTAYIITITGHYIAYCNGIVIDNHTRFGTPITECKWLGKAVKNYYQISNRP